MFGDRYTSEELRQIKSSGLRSERENIEIPVSINLLINKRLERLSVTELSILQYASVIGNEFTDTLLNKTAKLLSDETDIGEFWRSSLITDSSGSQTKHSAVIDIMNFIMT